MPKQNSVSLSSRRSILLVLLSCLLAPTQALACSIAPPRTEVSCTVSDTFLGVPIGDTRTRGYLVPDQSGYMNFLMESSSKHSDAEAFLTVSRATITINLWRQDKLPLVTATILSHCAEDTRPAQAAFITHLEKRHEVSMEPYSARREAELRAENERYLSCSYRPYERAGDWLISREKQRDYCYSARGGGGSCPVTMLSWSGLFFYLVGNVDATTAPYLLGALLILAALGGFTVYLYRRGEVRAFLRPGIINSALVILMTLMLLFLWVASVKWLLAAYLAGSLLSYPWRRWRRARRATRAS